jgi:hypothetical protein
MRGAEEVRLRFPARRRRLRRRFHFAPGRALQRFEQKLAGFISCDHLGERLLRALAISTKFCSTTLDRGEVM